MRLDRLPDDVRAALTTLVEACASPGMMVDGNSKQGAIGEAIRALTPRCAAWDRQGRILAPLAAPPARRGRSGRGAVAPTPETPADAPPPPADPES